ncbi:MAG TPA: diguanylate cyclase [Steroidobacteraceae bacterium]|jgi:diguanylate cyclase (GGDEF)-like protein/PAS domain S-box-containing protein|nr:diguanylate cyclase [Steroidobacteraceae bacterium]
MTCPVKSEGIATLHPLDVDTVPRLELMDACLQAASDAVLVLDENARAVYLNHAAEDLSGWTSSHAIGKAITEIWHTDGEATASTLKSPAVSFKHAVLSNRLGQRVEIEHQITSLNDQNGRSLGFMLVARKIPVRQKGHLSLLMSAEALDEHAEALFAERERAQVTLDSIGDAVVSTDFRGHVAYLNKAAERLTGWIQADAQGLPAASVFQLVDVNTGESTPCPATEAIIENQRRAPAAASCVLIRRDGEAVPVEVAATPIHDRVGGVVGAVMVGHDVTAARKLSDKLAHLALHDHLTDLPNRTLFNDRMEQAITLARRSGSHLSLMYIDLDRFKEINDTLGHLVGDEVLRMAAQRLLGCVRASDTVSRQGGDEFIALLIDCDFDEAKSCAQKIVDSLSAPYDIGNHRLTLSASIGIAQYPQDATDTAALIKAADTAMYVVKCARRERARTPQSLVVTGEQNTEGGTDLRH